MKVVKNVMRFVVFSICAVSAIASAQDELRAELEKKSLIPTIQYYAPGNIYKKNDPITAGKMETELRDRLYKKADSENFMQKGSYFIRPTCTEDIPKSVCIRVVDATDSMLIFGETGLLFILDSATKAEKPYFQTTAQLIATSLGNQPIDRIWTPLADIPLTCLHAIVATEDREFLQHKGVSIKSVARAFWTNLKAMRVKQGGSTLTQQLVKNQFLTSERTFSRKWKEFFLSMKLELQMSKDDILENYTNIIYLGQNGQFEIRGLGSASVFYFRKKVSELETQQCALLAAMIAGPGTYNPFKNIEKATTRRNQVLNNMVDAEYLDAEEATRLKALPLGLAEQTQRLSPAPYYMTAVNRELKKLGFDEAKGYQILTGMSPRLQTIADQVAITGSEALDKRYKNQPKLELALISARLSDGLIDTVIGGRKFSTSPFHRAIDGRRPIGSTMKPFVYLTALLEKKDFNAISVLQDKPIEIKIPGTPGTWKPMNYDRKLRGNVPAAFALKESLNLPAVHLGLEVGISKVISVLRTLGSQVSLSENPSLALGAVEMSPLELLELYFNFAQEKSVYKPRFIQAVRDLNGELLYEAKNEEPVERIPWVKRQELMRWMEQTAVTGTAKAARAMGWDGGPIAAKTGTTNDGRDAWFVGITDERITVVWVGSDTNQAQSLTGAGAALPLWISFMKNLPKNPNAHLTMIPNDFLEEKIIDYKSLDPFKDIPDLQSEPPAPLLFPRQ